MSINAPTPNTISIGHAIATIPVNANRISATAPSTKIIKHKVIIVAPPFCAVNCFIIEGVKFSKKEEELFKPPQILSF